MSEQRRRDNRYPARIVVRLVRRNETIELLTNDVSFRGAFVRTDAELSLRHLVRVSFDMPSGEIVQAHAMVVHVVRGDRNDPLSPVPGVGLQFWGPMNQAREWEQFVYGLKMKDKAGKMTAQVTDKVRRASERLRLSLDVDLEGEVTKTRDVSQNGMAIRTEKKLPIGMKLRVNVRAQGRTAEVDVEVRRHIDEPDFQGIGVEFTDVAAEPREKIVALVQAEKPKEDEIYVFPDDPKLH